MLLASEGVVVPLGLPCSSSILLSRSTAGVDIGMDSGMADRRAGVERWKLKSIQGKGQTYLTGSHALEILTLSSPNENTFFHPQNHRKDRVHEKRQEDPQKDR